MFGMEYVKDSGLPSQKDQECGLYTEGEIPTTL